MVYDKPGAGANGFFRAGAGMISIGSLLVQAIWCWTSSPANTTGWVAEGIDGLWLAFEECREYLAASSFRFLGSEVTTETMKMIYGQIETGRAFNLSPYSVSTQIQLTPGQ